MKQTVLLEDQDWVEMRQGEMRQIVVSPGTTSLLVGYFSSRPSALRGNGGKHYTAEFKQTAVARVRSGEARAAVAQALGVWPSMIATWAKDKRFAPAASSNGVLKALPPPKKGERRTYPPEYKAAVVAHIKSGSRVADLVRELKIERSVIDKWRRQ